MAKMASWLSSKMRSLMRKPALYADRCGLQVKQDEKLDFNYIFLLLICWLQVNIIQILI